MWKSIDSRTRKSFYARTLAHGSLFFLFTPKQVCDNLYAKCCTSAKKIAWNEVTDINSGSMCSSVIHRNVVLFFLLTLLQL